ncbi:MAG: lysylphosphatidylglycerol synthase transmembrane domain-containing protein [Siphonobacter sp.]
MNAKLYKAIFFAIGVVTLVYMVYATGVEIIWLNIKKTGFWFVPVIGSWLIIYLFNAFAFKTIIQEADLPETHLPFWSVLRVTITGYAINYITPFVALGGEPYRIMELKPALGVNKATSSVLLYSLMHMFSHVLFWLASIILIVVFIPLGTPMLMGCGVLFVAGITLGSWFLKVYKRGFTVSTFRALAKIPLIRKKVQTFAFEKADMLQEIDHQIRVFYSERKSGFFISLFWEFIARVVGCTEIYFAAKGIGLEMTLVESLIISSGSSLFANLIFFFPMQLGTREGGLALALKSIGMPAASGVLIGLVMRVREIVWIFIGLILIRIDRKISPQVVETVLDHD